LRNLLKYKFRTNLNPDVLKIVICTKCNVCGTTLGLSWLIKGCRVALKTQVDTYINKYTG